MKYWLVKSEPSTYSWDDFQSEGTTEWTGVRNYQARNNLKEMKKGDLVMFYHSNFDKAVMGVGKVTKEFFQDPTTGDPNWVAVVLKPFKKLKNPVTLTRIKASPELKEIALVRNGRLSVMPLTKEEFDIILSLGS